jgi:transcriptional regulator with XRE-family HTH domain
MTDLARRAELADFLRDRREALDPISVGLQPGPRRRTPGLRREEVAQLSGVSHTWYTWLEQRRDITVSRQVLDSLARALRLSAVERRHLFTLAGVALPDEQPARPVVTDTLRRLVQTLEPKPRLRHQPVVGPTGLECQLLRAARRPRAPARRRTQQPLAPVHRSRHPKPAPGLEPRGAPDPRPIPRQHRPLPRRSSRYDAAHCTRRGKCAVPDDVGRAPRHRLPTLPQTLQPPLRGPPRPGLRQTHHR